MQFLNTLYFKVHDDTFIHCEKETPYLGLTTKKFAISCVIVNIQNGIAINYAGQVKR